MKYEVVRSTVGDALWGYVVEHSPQTIRYMEDPNDKGDYHCFVAVTADSDFVGLSVIDIGPMRFGPLADQTVGFLENILVLRPYRRRGVGRALLRAALEAAWQRRAEHVRWTVTYENEALHFYRSVGAVFIPEEDPQAEDPEKYYTVVMVNPQLASDKDSVEQPL